MWVHVQVTHIKEPSGNSISCSQFFKGIWFIFLYVYKKFSVKKWNTCLHYCSNLSSLKDFLNIFERRLFYSLSLHYYSIKNTAKTVILWKIITIYNFLLLFKMSFIHVMAKLNFQKPLLFGVTSDMVLQKSFLYAGFVLMKHFLLLSVLKNSSVETMIHFMILWCKES